MLGTFCQSSPQENTGALPGGVGAAKPSNIKETIRLAYSAKHIESPIKALEIRASLINDGTDTVYFLTTTCDGEQYSLQYDTAKFVQTTLINCNASFPMLVKIAPKEQHFFQAHFKAKGSESKITLGFDFYAVSKSFNVAETIIADIHRRKREEQYVIWGEETPIQ